MTETEWLSCTDPGPMLDFLRATGRLSDRKARLFAVACCRRIWPLLKDDRSRRAVEFAEQSADGVVTFDELRQAMEAGIRATWQLRDEEDARWPAETPRGMLFAAEAAEMTAWRSSDGDIWWTPDGYAAWEAAVEASAHGESVSKREEEQAYQCDLLRDLFGPWPFREGNINPSLLTWTDGAIPGLAQAIYDERSLPEGRLDLGRLAELADVLERAGCHDEEVLAHLRQQGGVHARGCWVLDLLLQKE